MSKRKHIEAQIVEALKQVEGGRTAAAAPPASPPTRAAILKTEQNGALSSTNLALPSVRIQGAGQGER